MTLGRTIWTTVGVAITLLAGSVARAQNDASSVHISINPMSSFDKAAFKGFVDRPLFDPARSLPPPLVATLPPPPPPVVAPPDPPPNVHLLGIIQGDVNFAIVRHDSDPKTQVLSSGDHIDAWEVTVLPTIGLRLRNGDRVVDYALFDKAGATPEVTPSSNLEVAPAPPAQTTDARNARPLGRTY